MNDHVRVKLLDDWGRAHAFYEQLNAQREAWAGVSSGQFLLRNLDALLAMTQDDIERIRRRASKPLNQ